MLLDDGTSVRPELTYVIDVATRSICVFALSPVETKAIDAALLLAANPAPGKAASSSATSDRPLATPLTYEADDLRLDKQ